MSSIPLSEDNPFRPLIKETNDDPTQLQLRYENHRVSRNKQQSEKILAESFAGWTLDEILKRLDGPEREEGFVDPRNCLVIWARPPAPIRDLISWIQSELKDVAPCKWNHSIWLMPLPNLHTTVLEVAHSLTEQQIEELVQTLQLSKGTTKEQIVEYAMLHQTRLLKPMVSFDSAALALSFVPSSGEGLGVSGGDNPERYTYHHLRRDIFDMVRQASIPVASRYIVPSAHVTIARFINHDGFQVQGVDGKEDVDRTRVRLLIDKINEINQRLEVEYWPQAGGTIPKGGEWVVGQEQGLVIRRGRVWYGGGEYV
ncbi:RNA ligase/cyclic nucleotide phosphodiesterase [Penicillium macrosclerotiorum]|uniref:RNA ligase/cyclic nucleotide phosphodiesterase n=1 Tax=Penicillium macrosclerotiorum TaxID=303699 RepID=UPI0025484935|nr:RNA ligase/cyclic nucleotide phosphodiesterase [Penicillium macrosclerotiorum]KAJ5669069.1 RNA ligase/cyclic nucleotide phosphodiesterase [Penicillium macrosclerotiorum]